MSREVPLYFRDKLIGSYLADDDYDSVEKVVITDEDAFNALFKPDTIDLSMYQEKNDE